MKNLFEAETVEEVKERMAQLRPDSERLWGKMNPAQTLAHCSAAMEMAVGERTPRRILIGRLLGRFAKKSMIVNEKPMPHNVGTDKSLVVSDADHGAGVGWKLNTSENGLVVNGNQVTIYGLFVEHHQQFQVLWKGNGGRTYFYQSEIPYDPPNQASYTSTPGVNGWASYKVADGVTTHEAWGLGVYSVFIYPGVGLTRAIETPKSPEVRFHDMITVALGDHGVINHVIDDTGEAAVIHPRVTPKVTDFP
jgi:hypothetical protein